MSRLPPLIGGYRCVPHWSWFGLGGRTADTYERREGYFLMAGLMCLNLIPSPDDPTRGTLTGYDRIHRGAVSGSFKERAITRGEWATRPNADLPNVQEGTIHTFHQDDSQQEIQNNYLFIVRNGDEMDWVLYSTHLATDPIEVRYRSRLLEGTFRRLSPI